MKIKLFAMLFIAIFASGVFAAPKLSQEEANALIAKIEKAKDANEKASFEAQSILGRMDDVESFQKIIEVFTAAHKKYGSDNSKINTQIGQIACWWFDGKFANEGYEFAKQKKDIFVLYIILHRDSLLTIVPEKEKFEVIKKHLLEEKVPKNRILVAIKFLQNKSVVIGNNEEMKLLLQDLNKMYTIRLGTDKDFYGPIVATIRLALSAY